MPTKEDFGDGRNSLLAGRDRRQFLAATGLASADFLAKTTSVRGNSVLPCQELYQREYEPLSTLQTNITEVIAPTVRTLENLWIEPARSCLEKNL